jgi:hypothetical protein
LSQQFSYDDLLEHIHILSSLLLLY